LALGLRLVEVEKAVATHIAPTDYQYQINQLVLGVTYFVIK